MSSVDKRTVEMAFDNKQFEQGVGTSLNTIDKLKKSLNFEGAEKALQGLITAGKRFHLDSIAENVETITHKFSALGVIGLTVLSDLTTKAVESGIEWLRALTLKPAEMGFQEYETQMNSIQTILANTSKDGTVLANVVDALDVLNEYSDKTIYNFTQMTRNIGTFTAAGVKLNVSVAAIKGIANLAAVSGSNADQASTAMYQLSQALASGTVKLQDWNSVVNAGMGGKVFQDALMETARAHGVAIDQMIKEEGSFRETLQKGWITSEVLTETLSKFTGDLTEQQLLTMGYTQDQIKEIIKMGQMANDAATKVKTITQLMDTLNEAQQSGWTKTWQIIVGDFDEAKTLMTEISGIFGSMIGEAADARNAILESWKNLGGRRLAVETLRNALDAVLNLVKPIKEAFREIFPPVTGMQLYNITLALYNLSKNLKIGEETAAKVKRAFKGFFAILDIGKLALLSLIKSFGGLKGPIEDSASGLLDWLANAGDWIVGLRDQIKATDAFGKGIQKIKDFIAGIQDKLKPFISDIKKMASAFTKVAKVDTGGLDKFLGNLKEKLGSLSRFGQLIFKLFSLAGKAILIFQKLVLKLLPGIFDFSGKAADGIGEFLDTIIEKIEHFDFQKFFSILNAGLLSALILAVKSFIKNGGIFIDKAFGALDGGTNLVHQISSILDSVRGALEAYQTNLKADTLLKIAGALAILTASVFALSLIDPDKLAAALLAMTVMFVELGVSFAIFDKIMSSAKLADMGKMAMGLTSISVAILILAGAVAILSKLKPEELGRGLFAVGALLSMLVTSSTLLSKSSSKMVGAALGLVIFAGALSILVGAVERLANLDERALTRGLIGIGVLCAELVLFMKSTDMSGMGIVKSVGILILAGALTVLALAVERLANIDANKMMQGLLGVGIILAEIAIFVQTTGDSSKVISTALGLVILSGALFILSEVVIRLGEMSWEKIAKGLVAMAGALAIITIAAQLLPKDLMITGTSLVIVAGALFILSQALNSMGSMSWEEVGRSLTALAGSFIILAIGLRAMSGTLSGVAALILAAGALAILAPPLKLLGSMDLAQIGLALLALAGVFVVFGVAGILLLETIPAILALAASLFLIGLAAMAIGAGVALIGVGILSIALALTAMAAAGTAGITAVLFAITGIVGLIPMIVQQIGIALLALLQVLVDGFPLILKALEILLLGVIDIIVKVVPKLVDAIVILIDSILKTVSEHLPSIIQSGVLIVNTLLTGIRDHIGETNILAAQIIVNFLKALSLKMPELVDAGYKFIIAFINGLAEAVDANMPALMVATTKLSLAIIEGLIKGWFDSSAAIRQGMWDIMMVVVNAAKEALGIHSPSTVFLDLGIMALQGLINGIQSKVAELKGLLLSLLAQGVLIFTQAKIRFLTMGVMLLASVISGIVSLRNDLLSRIRNIIDSSITLLANKLQEFKNTGARLIQGLVDGFKQTKDALVNTTQDLVGSVKKTIDEKIQQFTDLGHSVVEGFQRGIGEYIYKAVEEANKLAAAVLDVIRSVLGINSPSDETKDDALNLVLGMVGGLKQYTNLAVKAAKDLGTKTLSGLSESLSLITDSIASDMDMAPTIRPVIDMSEIEKGSGRLNDLLRPRTIDVSSSVNKANEVSARISTPSTASVDVNATDAAGSTTTVEFNQYNSSPKALSRTEIYRQTKNQLSSLKKQVGNI